MDEFKVGQIMEKAKSCPNTCGDRPVCSFTKKWGWLVACPCGCLCSRRASTLEEAVDDWNRQVGIAVVKNRKGRWRDADKNNNIPIGVCGEFRQGC